MTAELPDTPVGRALGWAISVLRGEHELEADEVRERFTAEMLAAVPAEQFVLLTDQVRRLLDGFDLEGLESTPSATEAVAVLAQPSGDVWRLRAAVEEAAPHRLKGLLIQPAPDLRKEPAARSWPELEEKLSEHASHVGFLASEIVRGDVIPIHAVEPDARLAIGSTFKLYVLGELAGRVETGEAAWNEELAVDAALRSIPSGVTQEDKAGTVHTLQTYAERMISISDNTATDHLLHRLGRETVEGVQEIMGHAHPEWNVPFLTTREMTVIKLGLSAAQQRTYLEADPQTRRAILEQKVAKRRLPKVELPDGWSEPRLIGEVEWFASPADLARAMAWLGSAMARPGLEPVRKILSMNPGLPFDRYAWTWVGFKGGGEPGVFSMTWLLRRLDERVFVLTATLNDDSTPPGPLSLVSLMPAAAVLLQSHRKRPKRRSRLKASRA